MRSLSTSLSPSHENGEIYGWQLRVLLRRACRRNYPSLFWPYSLLVSLSVAVCAVEVMLNAAPAVAVHDLRDHDFLHY